MSVLVIILYFRKSALNQFEGMHGAWTLVDDMPGFYPCGIAATTSATPRQLREHLVLRHLTQITKPSLKASLPSIFSSLHYYERTSRNSNTAFTSKFCNSILDLPTGGRCRLSSHAHFWLKSRERYLLNEPRPQYIAALASHRYVTHPRVCRCDENSLRTGSPCFSAN
jgi:hypothetical protein